MTPGLTTQMRDMMLETAARCGVPAHRLVSPGKEKRVTSARRAWFYDLAIVAGYSYSEIGLRTGFDHTSVMYGVRKRSREIFGTAPKASIVDIRAAWNATKLEEAA
jgi:chromosomal replication initiation ATPase DnaA